MFGAIYPALNWIFSTMFHGAVPEVVVLGVLGVLTFFLGLFNSFISVPAQTALQERSPEKIRARVFSAFFTISNAILIVPVFFAGTLADGIGYTQTILLIGVAVLLISGWGFYRSRERRAAAVVSSNGHENGYVTVEEAEAALTTASPAPRPVMARDIQEQAEKEPPRSGSSGRKN
jgi:MFS family permease